MMSFNIVALGCEEVWMKVDVKDWDTNYKEN